MLEGQILLLTTARLVKQRTYNDIEIVEAGCFNGTSETDVCIFYFRQNSACNRQTNEQTDKSSL